MTLKPCLTAYSMPAIAAEVVPLPREFMNFTASSLVDQQTPAMPVPLSPRAPTIPATCVPCPLSSCPEPLPSIALKP